MVQQVTAGADYFTDDALGERRRNTVLLAELRNARASFESHWRDIGEHVAPRRLRFTTTDNNRGDKRNQKIIDPSPVYALRTMKSGMQSGVTSPARPWFELATEDPALNKAGPVKQYLDDVRDLMLRKFARSNLYNALPVLYGDMGAFGTGAMAVLEDEKTSIRCVPFAIGEYFLAVDARGRVSVFARTYQMSVRQILEQFGRFGANGQITNWSNLSQRVRDAFNNGLLGQMIDVVHIIKPNRRYNPKRLEATAKKFVECYYEPASPMADVRSLREGGYDEFPILAGRWGVTSGDVYATECPGMDALGDIKQLQHGEKNAAQILDKINKPPMIASTGMFGSKLSQLPGDVSFVDETKDAKFRPAIDVSGFRFDLLEGKQAAIRQRISRAFYEDLFLLLEQADRPDMTATEIIERKEEKLLALGPMLENLNQDVLDPLIERTFGILHRRGELPEAPPELEGVELHIEYVSIMAQAQRAVGRSGIDGFTAYVGQVAAVDPSALDVVNVDELVKQAAERYNVPAQVIVDDDAVAQKRQQRAQQQQAAQQAQTIQTAATAAQTLSQTDTAGKNALTDILGPLSGAMGDPRAAQLGTVPGGHA